MKKLIFRNKRAIGDNLIFTTTIRELHKQYPQQHQTGIATYYPEVYYNNQFITLFDLYDKHQNIPIIDIDYGDNFQHRKTSGKHFAEFYINEVNKKLNLNIELTDCRPHLTITVEEITKAKEILEKQNIPEKFWLLSPAIKQDIPLKNYSAKRWQEFCNLAKENNINIVQTGDSTALNPCLKNIISLVGKLNLREYFAVALLSRGMIGHVSLQTHLAAALNKPCITVAGSREGNHLYSYPKQHYLHSIGFLECCKETACWKKTIQDCENYDYQKGISGCMQLINPKQIVDIVLKYEGRY